jgi:hypothetical protein
MGSLLSYPTPKTAWKRVSKAADANPGTPEQPPETSKGFGFQSEKMDSKRKPCDVGCKFGSRSPTARTNATRQLIQGIS